MSIGGVKAIEIGAGISAAESFGSQNNDSFRKTADGRIRTLTNHAGGILGGISDGEDILLKVYFKPTPSISKEQDTVDTAGNEMKLSIAGRHDPVIVPRALVVIECMAALTLADALLLNATARLETLRKLWG